MDANEFVKNEKKKEKYLINQIRGAKLGAADDYSCFSDLNAMEYISFIRIYILFNLKEYCGKTFRKTVEYFKLFNLFYNL